MGKKNHAVDHSAADLAATNSTSNAFLQGIGGQQKAWMSGSSTSTTAPRPPAPPLRPQPRRLPSKGVAASRTPKPGATVVKTSCGGNEGPTTAHQGDHSLPSPAPSDEGQLPDRTSPQQMQQSPLNETTEHVPKRVRMSYGPTASSQSISTLLPGVSESASLLPSTARAIPTHLHPATRGVTANPQTNSLRQAAVPVRRPSPALARAVDPRTEPSIMNGKPNYDRARRVLEAYGKHLDARKLLQAPEARRINCLQRACMAEDFDFLFLHQMAYMWIQSIPLPQEIQSFNLLSPAMFKIVELLDLKDIAKDLGAEGTRFYCEFPISAHLWSCLDLGLRRANQQKLKDMLSAIFTHFDHFKEVCRKETCLPAVSDLANALKIESPTVQSIVFEHILRHTWFHTFDPQLGQDVYQNLVKLFHDNVSEAISLEEFRQASKNLLVQYLTATQAIARDQNQHQNRTQNQGQHPALHQFRYLVQNQGPTWISTQTQGQVQRRMQKQAQSQAEIMRSQDLDFLPLPARIFTGSPHCNNHTGQSPQTQYFPHNIRHHTYSETLNQANHPFVSQSRVGGLQSSPRAPTMPGPIDPQQLQQYGRQNLTPRRVNSGHLPPGNPSKGGAGPPVNTLIPIDTSKVTIPAAPLPDRSALHELHLRSPLMRPLDGEWKTGEQMFRHVTGFLLAPILLTSAQIQSFAFFIPDDMELPLEVASINSVSGERAVTRNSRFLRLRCVKWVGKENPAQSESSWSIAKTEWLKFGFWKVNGRIVEPRRKFHNTRDLPIDITSFVRKGGNSLQLSFVRSFDDSSELPYALAIEIVSLISKDEIRAHCDSIGFIPSDTSLKSIIKSIKPAPTDDDDIAIVDDKEIICMLDPWKGGQIWDTPVRGKTCTHRQCFDLELLLATRPGKSEHIMSNADGWKCPLCKGDVRPSNLIQDGFLLEVRKQLEKDGTLGTRHIIIERDGTWKPKPEEVPAQEKQPRGSGNKATPQKSPSPSSRYVPHSPYVPPLPSDLPVLDRQVIELD